MPIELQGLSAILSFVTAISLVGVEKYFHESQEANPLNTNKAAEKLQQLVANVSREMEHDVERSLILTAPTGSIWIDATASRRGETALQLASEIWECSRRQTNLDNLLNSWSHWDNSGRYTCGVGAYLNGIVCILLLIDVILLLLPKPVIINPYYLWIVPVTIGLPLIWAFICYIFTNVYKQKFIKLRDS